MADPYDTTTRWANSLRQNFPNGAADLDPASAPTGQPNAKPRLRDTGIPTNSGRELVTRPNFTFGDNSLPSASSSRDLTVVPGQSGRQFTAPFASEYPGNPNVSGGGSNESANWYKQSGTAGPVPKPSLGADADVPLGGEGKAGWFRNKIDSALDVAKGAQEASGQALRSGLDMAKKVVPPVAIGGGLGYAGRYIGSGDATPEQVKAHEDWQVKSGANQIPVENNGKRGQVTPGRVDNFWEDTEAGRNINNALVATAPLAGPGGFASTLRAGSGMARAAATGEAVLGGVAAGIQAADAKAASERAAIGQQLPPNWRGKGFDDPRVFKPSDFEPKSIPDGSITKTVDPKTGKVTYSGKDVKDGADMYSSDGKKMSLREIGIAPAFKGGASFKNDQALSDARFAAAQRGDWDAVKASYGEGGGAPSGPVIIADSGGHGILDKGYQARQELQRSMVRGPDESRRAYADRMQMAATLRGQDLNFEADRRRDATLGRGQDLNYASSMRGHDVTLRGQNMDYDRALVPLQTAQQQRQMQAAAMQAAGGDPKKAATLLLRAGGDPKNLMEHNAQLNTDEVHNEQMNNQATDRLRKEFTVYRTNKDGSSSVDEAGTTQAMQMMRSLFPNLEHSDAATRNAAMAKAQEAFGMFKNIKDQDYVGINAWNPFAAKRPELRGMPDVRGAKVEQLSGLGGPLTIGAENGDTIVTLPNGQQTNFKSLNAAQLEMLHNATKKNSW